MASTFLLTPPGMGAIAVVRVLGADAPAVIEKIFRPQAPPSHLSEPSDRLRYGWIVDGRQRVDDVLVSRVDSPNGIAVDISAHGGIRVIERILGLLDRSGARLVGSSDATPSCWPVATRIERDAMIALSIAKTERAVRFLAWQRRHAPAALRKAVSMCDRQPGAVCEVLSTMIQRSSRARILLDGAEVAIIGPPNSGKSTLLNALVGRRAVLVSDRAGTTRDWVSETVSIKGIPFTLVDTAGRHAANGTIEGQAIEAARRIEKRAAVCILVLDATCPPDKLGKVVREFEPVAPCIVAMNKVDLGVPGDVEELPSCRIRSERTIRISAGTGAGLDKLCAGLLDVFGLVHWEDKCPAFISDEQIAVAREALSALASDPTEAAAIIERRFLGSGTESST